MGLFSKLFGPSGAGPSAQADTTDSMSRIAPEQLEQIQALALAGQQIRAVKLYREAAGCGLKEAKLAVDQIVRASR